MEMQAKTRAVEKEILVVEDSDTQTAVLKGLLEQNGYKAALAKNGAEGLSMARKNRPALVISDILMPVMDGYQMCREIKNSEKLKDIPVILLTQLTEPEEVIKGLEAGADTYITKPYDGDYLISKVESLLKNPVQFRNKPEERVVELEYAGKHYAVHSGRAQALSFLLSTYENAMRKTRELVNAQEELRTLNEDLEEKIKKRTEALTKEVAERKQAEKALMDSEERFRAVVESASDAVVCLEPPDNIYLWNKKAEEIFGYSCAEAVGKRLHDLVAPERYLQKAKEGLSNFFKTGTGSQIGKTLEIEAVRKDGTEFSVELSISAVNMHGVWNSVGIIREITGRKRMEDEIKQNLDEAERMNKLMVAGS